MPGVLDAEPHHTSCFGSLVEQHNDQCNRSPFFASIVCGSEKRALNCSWTVTPNSSSPA